MKPFQNGDGLYIISDALCGLHHYEPWTKRMIPQSWKLFSVWRRLEGPDRAPPLTKLIIYSWTNYAIAHSDLKFAALICLGFFALLRTGELLQVRPCDILLGRNSAIVSLPHTKSGQQENVAEMVAFDDFLTLELLRAVIMSCREDDLINVPIWNKSPQAFRERLRFTAVASIWLVTVSVHIVWAGAERHGCFNPQAPWWKCRSWKGVGAQPEWPNCIYRMHFHIYHSWRLVQRPLNSWNNGLTFQHELSSCQDRDRGETELITKISWSKSKNKVEQFAPSAMRDSYHGVQSFSAKRT